MFIVCYAQDRTPIRTVNVSDIMEARVSIGSVSYVIITSGIINVIISSLGHVEFLIPSVLWHCWLGNWKGIWRVKKSGFLFVGGDILTGALHVL